MKRLARLLLFAGILSTPSAFCVKPTIPAMRKIRKKCTAVCDTTRKMVAMSAAVTALFFLNAAMEAVALPSSTPPCETFMPKHDLGSSFFDAVHLQQIHYCKLRAIPLFWATAVCTGIAWLAYPPQRPAVPNIQE
jgi:hypothetical protein